MPFVPMMLWSEVQMVSIERDTMRQEGLARAASTLAISVTQWLGKVNLDGFWSLRSDQDLVASFAALDFCTLGSFGMFPKKVVGPSA